MEKSKVYYTSFRTTLDCNILQKLRKLITRAGMPKMDLDGKFTAVKIHFGEMGNVSFLRPNYARAVVDVVNELGGALPRMDQVRHDIDPVLNVPYSGLSRITNKIIMIVRTDYRRTQTLTGIAEGMHMSSKYIGRIFLKDTGMKFSEYLMAYRMLEARKLIVGTQEKISVIAGMVGYVQLNNFYIHFRNYFGVSPSALRNFETAAEPAEV